MTLITDSSIKTGDLRLIFKVSLSYNTVYKVIILVNEATSLLSVSYLPNSNYPVFESSTHHDSADKWGAGLSTSVLANLISNGVLTLTKLGMRETSLGKRENSLGYLLLTWAFLWTFDYCELGL